MRVAHLTSVHPARDVRIYVKECRTLQGAGYQVSLIAPHCADFEDELGVELIPVHKRSGRLSRMVATTWEVFRRARKSGAQVVHFHDPELLPVGVLLRLSGLSVIYDVHENVPDQVLGKDWIPGRLRSLISWSIDKVERTCAHLFDGIVAATPKIAERFPVHKTVIVQNFPVLTEFEPAQTQESDSLRNRLVYVGAVTELRGIKQMVSAMEIIRCVEPEIRLSIAGHFFDEALFQEASTMPGWENVDFLGWKSREEIAELLSGALAGMVVLHPTKAYMDAYPVKMFEYMAAGIPVIASDFPMWRSIVEVAQCGVLADPMDPQAIANAALWLFENPQQARKQGQAGVLATKTRFCWSGEGEKLLNLYSRVSSLHP